MRWGGVGWVGGSGTVGTTYAVRFDMLCQMQNTNAAVCGWILVGSLTAIREPMPMCCAYVCSLSPVCATGSSDVAGVFSTAAGELRGHGAAAVPS